MKPEKVATADQVMCERDGTKVVLTISCPDEYQAMMVYDLLCDLARKRELTFLKRDDG